MLDFWKAYNIGDATEVIKETWDTMRVNTQCLLAPTLARCYQ